MSIFMNYDTLLCVIRVWGTLIAIWPLDFKAGKLKNLFYKIFWCIHVANMTIQCYLLIKDIFPFNGRDFVNTMKTVVELTFSLEAVFNLLYVRIKKRQLQVNTAV